MGQGDNEYNVHDNARLSLSWIMKNGKLCSATLVSLCPSKSVINSGVAAMDPCLYRTWLRICSKVLKSQENAYLECFHSTGRQQIKMCTKRGSKRR